MRRQSSARALCQDPDHGKTQPLVATVPVRLAGSRLDQVLATLFPDYSRTRMQGWIRGGQATVNGQTRRPRDLVEGGERIEVYAEPHKDASWGAQPLPLDIVFEDDDLIVVNKPAGLVVHPGAGNPDGTLVNALLHYEARLARVPRAGIVHRLDKDTTGLLVVARNLIAHKQLVEQIKVHAARRDYDAVVLGVVAASGRIDEPIGRHRVQRTRMTVARRGKPATTRFRVVRRFHAYTQLRVTLDTGRTHQIRVHMAFMGHPVLGDPVYGSRRGTSKAKSPRLEETLGRFRRQALHAGRLVLRHPAQGRVMRFDAPLPWDMRELLEILRMEGGGT